VHRPPGGLPDDSPSPGPRGSLESAPRICHGEPA
jgi:hypothetical protein